MERLIKWFIHNSVAANMFMFFILIAGLLTLPRIKMEVFPDIDIDLILVSVIYPGASPKDVEDGICVRIEEKIQGLRGIKKISSTAIENYGTTSIEIIPGENINEILDRIKTQVDAINTFPDNAEKPVIQKITKTSEVITIAVSGNINEESLVSISEKIKDDIDALPDVTLTQLGGKKPREISIEISEENLKKYGISLNNISNIIRSNSIDMPGGSINTDDGEILIRSIGQSKNEIDYGNISILKLTNGSNLLLKNIATIKDHFSNIDLIQKFNGQPAILIRIYRTGNQSALKISKSVKQYVSDINKQLPSKIEVNTWNDEARILQGRIDLLRKNAYLGLFLVVGILALFLKPKLAFWVSLGIPISFMGGFWLMPTLDLSINMLSLFTFILVLGIVVDDAIIVGENIFQWKERGLNDIDAAIKGANQVAIPVTFAVLTTMTTFSPMLSVAGNVGQIWRIIPLVTIAVLVFSLIESLTILPAHLAHSKTDKKSRFNILNNLSIKWDVIQKKIKDALSWFIREKYYSFLKLSIQNKWTTLSISVSILLLTVGILVGGWMKFVFFPPIEGDLINALIAYPEGTPIEKTIKGLEIIETSAHQLEQQLKEEFPDEKIFINILSTAGDQPLKNKTTQGIAIASRANSGTHLAEMAVELSPGESRPISALEIATRWRKLAGSLPGVEQLTFQTDLFSAGDPINVQISSENLDELIAMSESLQEKLKLYPGVFDIKDSFKYGKQEIKLKLKPEAKYLGVSMSEISMQVRQAFYGLEVQSFQRGRDEVKVFLRYPESDRISMKNLEMLNIRTMQGNEIPLKQLVNMNLSKGFSIINRVDRRQSVNVTAKVNTTKVTANEILSSLIKYDLPELNQQYPSIRYSFEGEQREQNDSLDSLFKNFVFAMIIVYTLLAIPFKSYIQPIVIMGAIPFGLTGAVIGHIIMGQNLTILSLIGIVALSGVVVNDSLVLVDFINRYREDGNSIIDAVLEAGPRRFRPILLTSLTTFFGLFPLLMEKSLQAQFLIPMAISLAFGVLFATIITLIIVPTGYLIIEELKDEISNKLNNESL